MATYNRSNIIGFTIDSLLANTMTDWELIVVGDACTDNTEAVVARFADPRIRFVNLPENHGEQSGPNNEGVRLARGAYIAFLSHDDLWLPDHLARALGVFTQDPAADLVFGFGLALLTDDAVPELIGPTTFDRIYRPTLAVPASLWVMRRTLAERIGPWRPAGTIRLLPSQDWLQRCERAGARMVGSHHLAAIIPFSGTRRDSYRARLSEIQEHYAGRMTQPDFPARELLQALLRWEDPRGRGQSWPFLRESAKTLGRRLMNAAGIFPPSLKYWLQYWRKGSSLRHLRRTRGLPPHPRLR